MREAWLRSVLKRIAQGLPVAVGALGVASHASGCTHCYALEAGGSQHPRSALVEGFVGTPERFDPAGCNAVCRLLDGLDATDASVDAGSEDAGRAALLMGHPTERLVATCAYFGDGNRTLSCNYTDRFCETNASCSPTIYGRTPAGLVSRASLATTSLARWLADGAHLEAASVPAFEHLAAELAAFSAPHALVRAALRGAADERRHARALCRLSHRLGAGVAPVRLRETSLRDPETVAIDNAVEGCAREAYGALAAAYQAQTAASSAVRRAYRGIAADEARHALLSFAANDWLAPRLSRVGRRRVDEARRESLGALTDAVGREPEPTLRAVLGLPDATRGTDLVAVLS